MGFGLSQYSRLRRSYIYLTVLHQAIITCISRGHSGGLHLSKSEMFHASFMGDSDGQLIETGRDSSALTVDSAQGPQERLNFMRRTAFCFLVYCCFVELGKYIFLVHPGKPILDWLPERALHEHKFDHNAQSCCLWSSQRPSCPCSTQLCDELVHKPLLTVQEHPPVKSHSDLIHA